MSLTTSACHEETNRTQQTAKLQPLSLCKTHARNTHARGTAPTPATNPHTCTLLTSTRPQCHPLVSPPTPSPSHCRQFSASGRLQQASHLPSQHRHTPVTRRAPTRPPPVATLHFPVSGWAGRWQGICTKSVEDSVGRSAEGRRYILTAQMQRDTRCATWGGSRASSTASTQQARSKRATSTQQS